MGQAEGCVEFIDGAVGGYAGVCFVDSFSAEEGG